MRAGPRDLREVHFFVPSEGFWRVISFYEVKPTPGSVCLQGDVGKLQLAGLNAREGVSLATRDTHTCDDDNRTDLGEPLKYLTWIT